MYIEDFNPDFVIAAMHQADRPMCQPTVEDAEDFVGMYLAGGEL